MAVDSPCRFYVSTGCPTGANGQPMYVNTESCRTILYKVQQLQYFQDLAAIQKSKNNSTTILLASGVQQCVEPVPGLAAQHACLGIWRVATCLWLRMRLASSSSMRRLADLDAVFSAKCATADSDANCVRRFDALPLWSLQMLIFPLMD